MTGTADARVPRAPVPGSLSGSVPGPPPGSGSTPPGRRDRVRRLLASPLLAALASVLALAGAVALAGVRTLVHQCLQVDGPLAVIGVRLTLLQDAGDCPTGTLAVAPAASQGAVLVLGLVLPVVAAHAALGALGLGLTALLLRAAGTARRVLGAVVRALPAPAPHGPARSRRRLPVPGAVLVTATVLARTRHPHRGPPPAFA
jgi:hypothetical protein